MLRNTLLAFAALILAFVANLKPTATTQNLCAGIVEENSLNIPIHALQNGGISETEFHFVLDQIERYYSPLVRAEGKSLYVNRQWADGTVNASAELNGNTRVINMYGGLARYPAMTIDGFMLVACHEMGHHLAGAPKIVDWFDSGWASNEGQSDYFATLRCTRALMNPEDNAKFVQTQPIDPTVSAHCQTQFAALNEQNLCIRSAIAARSVAIFFQELRKVVTVPQFNTPDPQQVDTIFNSHPMPQCRMDTYFEGALCNKNADQGLSDSDPRPGTCFESNDHFFGVRPRCWFKL